MELYYPSDFAYRILDKRVNLSELNNLYERLNRAKMELGERGYSWDSLPELFSYRKDSSLIVVNFAEIDETLFGDFLCLCPNPASAKGFRGEYDSLDSALSRIDKITKKGDFEFLFRKPDRRIVDIN